MPDEPFKSLAESLGLAPAFEPSETEKLVDISDGKAFATAVLDSRDFRQYVVDALKLGNVPGFSGILTRLMDHAWGKAPDKVEITGKDGQPIEQVTTVRRVVVHPTGDRSLDEDLETVGNPRSGNVH